MGQGQEIHARKLVGQFMQTVSTFDALYFPLYNYNACVLGEIFCGGGCICLFVLLLLLK